MGRQRHPSSVCANSVYELCLINVTFLTVDTDPGVDDAIAMLFIRVQPQDSHILTEIIALWRSLLRK